MYVHWQNAVVPAGDYRFSFEARWRYGHADAGENERAAPRTGFVFLVSNTDEGQAVGRQLAEFSKLLPKGSYVTTMQLPEFGMTLHFPVPRHARRRNRSPRSEPRPWHLANSFSNPKAEGGYPTRYLHPQLLVAMSSLRGYSPAGSQLPAHIAGGSEPPLELETARFPHWI